MDDTSTQVEPNSNTNADGSKVEINSNFIKTTTFKLYVVQITTGILFWTFTIEHYDNRCFEMYVGIQSWILTL